ncbi:MAG TPA: circularly permuted type 2 ATP-grasp protein [Vicinamibacterales bacterium]|nr:circularly permuted type 2 ATP-grasp protein [Vicinamibacterales bacterium]
MTPVPHIHGAAAPWRLFEGYQPVDGVYDEMVVGTDRVRPHCEPFVRSVEDLGRHELASRWENAKRAIRDNGITYNVYGDPEGVDRPWALDVMPLLISSAEWNRLETALMQRTRLLNLVLADLYGPQQLLRRGLLPPTLVFANPAFLRPCHGIRASRDVYLHLHAAELARSPDGQWWVLGDRTQAPSGAGYALENRIVLSRMLPEAFRDCQVQRLASFFRAQRDTVTALAPKDRDRPKVALLTPGPNNETYFEHAYLARYLGFTLVEGGDLTVRDCRVFIKTLDGLQPVDVIFRRLDDSFCDPLELRGDSLLGVAGLVEAARTGNITIANALGSGVVETPAVVAFLPSLCRELLGEDLILPSVPTWWCGQPADLEYVVEHLDELVVKRAFRAGDGQPVFGRQLAAADKSALAAEIRARPEQFVGQEQVALSTAPVWVGQKLEPRPVVLRTYVTAAGDSYMVMPGGLARVAGARDLPIVSMQRGGGSKDTWVLSDGPVSAVSLLAPAGVPIRRERRATDLPSRVADDLYWLGRHVERAEHVVRLLRSVVARLTNEDTTEDTPELVALLQVLVALELLPSRLGEPMPLRDLEQELLAFLFKQHPHGGLRKTLNELRRIAAAVRDRLSIDTWRILNQLQQDFRLRHGRIQLDDVLAHMNRMITDLAAFSGMEMENMTRGHGWRFLDMGRRLERAVNLTTLLRGSLAARPSAGAMLDPLLEIADSSMTYRRRYFAQPQLAPVLDLLLADATNARALVYQLMALSNHVDHLPRDPKAPSPTREQRVVGQTLDTLMQADLDALCETTPEGQFPGVTRLLNAIERDLRALSDVITYYYFSHAELRVS